jgi:integrative and conjugative element protein (TIGR02256 family)
MADGFHEVSGTRVPPRRLTVHRARDLALRLERGDILYARLFQCQRSGTSESVVFEVDVEVPQQKAYPICQRERLAVTFYAGDEQMPKVEALRADFPPVPHLNLHVQECPRSICLYDERYELIKARLTASRLVRDIRGWLARTAAGVLHEEDQPLEPFLIGHAGHIVLPHDLFVGDRPARLYVTADRGSRAGGHFLITQKQPPSEKALPFVVSVHTARPEVHGIIRRLPQNLAELADLASQVQIDLLQETKDHLWRWHDEDRALLDYHIIQIILFPRVRTSGEKPERNDVRAFMLAETVRQVGVKLDLWGDEAGELGRVIAPDPSRRGADVAVTVLNPLHELTRAAAAALNGREAPAREPRIVAVGVGALGSQVVMNLARSGYGKWVLVDDDPLMPHNVARHALTGSFIGWPKSEPVAEMANDVLADATPFSALAADVLSPGERAEELATALREADVVLDLSASATVARKLACDADSQARRVSLFLTPTGKDLVLLAEDYQRQTRLDALEMQYYRALARDPRLEGMSAPAAGRRRYGQSCRDVTSTLPQSLVALHSAIAAGATETVLAQPGAAIAIWRADADGSTRRFAVEPTAVAQHQVGEWVVVVDVALLQRLCDLRASKVPNETGGVLLGSFDVGRGLVYVVDTVPSPPDSEEWPTLYIRGRHGLSEEVQSLAAKTDGMLEYVGEWHSHPDGFPTAPGRDDRQVFAWLAGLMAQEGLPPLMVTVGERGRVSCFVGKIGRGENLLAWGPADE